LMPLKKKEKIVVQSIGTMIALSDNNEVKVDLKNMKAEGKSTGLLKYNIFRCYNRAIADKKLKCCVYAYKGYK